MAIKISNIAVSSTAQKLELDWADVISRRNKLLILSDWTQLDDVGLNESTKSSWTVWRAQVRKIKKRKNATLEQVKSLLEILEKMRPDLTIDNELTTLLDDVICEAVLPVEDDLTPKIEIETETEITRPAQNVGKIYIEKQPIIIKEEITDEILEQKFYELFSTNPEKLQVFLKDVIDKTPQIMLHSNESLGEMRNKLTEYLILQQRYILEIKKKKLPLFDTINEKSAQAIEYLTIDFPVLDDYPLIALHAQITNLDPSDIAMKFLHDKKLMNTLILESEKFLMYNKTRIELYDTIESFRELIKDIKNGY